MEADQPHWPKRFGLAVSALPPITADDPRSPQGKSVGSVGLPCLGPPLEAYTLHASGRGFRPGVPNTALYQIIDGYFQCAARSGRSTAEKDEGGIADELPEIFRSSPQRSSSREPIGRWRWRRRWRFRRSCQGRPGGRSANALGKDVSSNSAQKRSKCIFVQDIR
jgi:hypothetical protein